MAEIKREVTFEVSLTEEEAVKLVALMEWASSDNRLDSPLYPIYRELEGLI